MRWSSLYASLKQAHAVATRTAQLCNDLFSKVWEWLDVSYTKIYLWTNPIHQYNVVIEERAVNKQ